MLKMVDGSDVENGAHLPRGTFERASDQTSVFVDTNYPKQNLTSHRLGIE